MEKEQIENMTVKEFPALRKSGKVGMEYDRNPTEEEEFLVTAKQYLSNCRAYSPYWLRDYTPGANIKPAELFRRKTVFYPGSWYDGQPVRSFNRARAEAVYLYADYGCRKEETIRKMTKENAFRGYSLLDLRELPVEELLPPDRKLLRRHPPLSEVALCTDETPYCLMGIYDRLPEYDGTHGAQRFALVFLFADAFGVYDAVFASHGIAPDAVIVQDHGFGGNYGHFGRSGTLEWLAKKADAYPRYLFCEDNGNAWTGYEKIPDVAYEVGGMHGNHRYLYRRGRPENDPRYDGFRYYGRSYSSHHLYKYNPETGDFYYMDHGWTGEGQWARREWNLEHPDFDICEIDEDTAQRISRDTLYLSRHYIV